ncbi:hypothetical protein V6N13_138471 [Hibiscus sabdariffa]
MSGSGVNVRSTVGLGGEKLITTGNLGYNKVFFSLSEPVFVQVGVGISEGAGDGIIMCHVGNFKELSEDGVALISAKQIVSSVKFFVNVIETLSPDLAIRRDIPFVSSCIVEEEISFEYCKLDQALEDANQMGLVAVDSTTPCDLSTRMHEARRSFDGGNFHAEEDVRCLGFGNQETWTKKVD